MSKILSLSVGYHIVTYRWGKLSSLGCFLVGRVSDWLVKNVFLSWYFKFLINSFSWFVTHLLFMNCLLLKSLKICPKNIFFTSEYLNVIGCSIVTCYCLSSAYRCIQPISSLALQTLTRNLSPQSPLLTALVTSLLGDFESLTSCQYTYLCCCLQHVDSADAADFLQLIAARVLSLSSGMYICVYYNNLYSKKINCVWINCLCVHTFRM